MIETLGIRWTPIFVIVTSRDTSFQKCTRELITELMSTYLSDSVKIAICLNTQVMNLKLIDPNYPNKHSLPHEATTTVIYSIQKSNRDTENSLAFINEMKDFDVRNTEHVASFLRSEIQSTFKAEKYMLFTWDHGAGYSIFQKEGASELVDQTKIIEKTNRMVSDQKIRKYVKAIERDSKMSASKIKELKDRYFDNSPDMLTVKELKDAINCAFEGRKIDVLIMTNCCMQTFDTGYELSTVVDYLIAPETQIYMNGYNYKAIIECVTKDPNVSNKKIAKCAIKSYIAKNKQFPIPNTTPLFDVAISAVDLRYYKVLAILLDEMAKVLTEKLDSDFSTIAYARTQISLMQPGRFLMLVDPYYYLNCVAGLINDGHFGLLLRIFNLTHRNAVKHIFKGRAYKRGGTEEKFRPRGFTIYFPQLSKDIATPISKFIDEKSPDVASFVKEFAWDNFVMTFANKNS